MDPIALVDEQIDAGRQLWQGLIGDGMGVTAAAWVRESENGRWYLYIASPIVDEQGIGAAYDRIHTQMLQLPQPSFIGSLQVKAIGSQDPRAEAIAGLQRRYPGRSGMRYGEGQLGHVSVEEVYVYPPFSAAKQQGASTAGTK